MDMTDSTPVFVADLWRRSNEVEQEQVFDPAELASLASAFSDAHAIQYGILAAFVICIYDYILTVGDEVRLFWPKTDYKLTTTLYFLSRYLPLFVLFVAICQNNPLPHIVFSDPFCKTNIIIIALSITAQNVISTWVFGLRIYTLYYHSKLVQRAMVIIFVLGTIVITILTGFISRTMIEGAKWFAVIEACIPPPSNLIPGVLVTSVVMETGLAAATVWHAITSSDFRQDLPQSSVINILNGIYVQGGLYFLVIVACRVTNMFLCWFASGSLFLVDVYIEFALTSVITTRWSIIMRETIHQSGISNTADIGPHPTRSQDGGTSHPGSYPLDRLDARIRKNRTSQIVSANIHFVKGSGSEGYTDSTPYSFIKTEPHIGANPHDALSIQEVVLGAADLNAHLENRLAEGMTMADIKEVNDVPRAPSIGSFPADLNNQGSGDTGAPVYKSKSQSASAAASTVSVGVRARLSADTVGRGSTGAHSMKDLDLA